MGFTVEGRHLMKC